MQRIVPGSKVDLFRSPVAIAVRAGSARPDIASEAALRRAVLAAPTIGYSTGPSGERWSGRHQRRSPHCSRLAASRPAPRGQHLEAATGTSRRCWEPDGNSGGQKKALR